MKTFRLGATLPRWCLWALVATVTSFFAARGASHSACGTLSWWIYTLLLAFLVATGPVGLFIHWRRCRGRQVTYLREEGLKLLGEPVIPWQRVRRVEHRENPFTRHDPLKPIEEADPRTLEVLYGVHKGSIHGGRPGCVAAVLGLWAGVLVIDCFMLPVVWAVAPWNPKIVLHLVDGTQIVLRDLEDDDVFVKLVRARIAPV